MTRCPRLLAHGLLVAVAAFAIPVVVASPAPALSCVGPREVASDAEQLYTGRVIDSDGGRLLVEVDEVWRGGPVEERVWLVHELPGWSAWADPEGRIPDGVSSSRTGRARIGRRWLPATCERSRRHRTDRRTP